MSAVIKPRRFKRIPAATPVLWVIAVMAFVFFLARFGSELFMQHELDMKIAAQKEANAALADENARLAASLQYYQSDKYVEQRAREDLNLRRSDEEVLIPVGDQTDASNKGTSAASSIKPQPGAAGAPAGPATGTQQADRPNWVKWFDLFNPFADSP